MTPVLLSSEYAYSVCIRKKSLKHVLQVGTTSIPLDILTLKHQRTCKCFKQFLRTFTFTHYPLYLSTFHLKYMKWFFSVIQLFDFWKSFCEWLNFTSKLRKCVLSFYSLCSISHWSGELHFYSLALCWVTCYYIHA